MAHFKVAKETEPLRSERETFKVNSNELRKLTNALNKNIS
jgi:hypothetical protein